MYHRHFEKIQLVDEQRLFRALFVRIMLLHRLQKVFLGKRVDFHNFAQQIDDKGVPLQVTFFNRVVVALFLIQIVHSFEVGNLL